MSVRPLPVTATFKPPGYYDSLLPNLKPSLSWHDSDDDVHNSCLSSNGSTDSLTSILHHDSYHSEYSDSDTDDLIEDSESREWDRQPIIQQRNALGERELSSYRVCGNIGSYAQCRYGGSENIHREFVAPDEASLVGTRPRDRSANTGDHHRQQRIVARKPGYPTGASYTPLSGWSLRSASSLGSLQGGSQHGRPRRPQASAAGGRPPGRPFGNARISRPIQSPKIQRRIRSSSTLSEPDSSRPVKSAQKPRHTAMKEHPHRPATTPEAHQRSESTSRLSDREADISSQRTGTESRLSESMDSHCDSLTHWEQWLLKKEKENRRQQRRERQRQAREEERKHEEEKAKEEKLARCDEKMKEWLKAKLKAEKKKKETEEERKRKEKQKEDDEKRKIAERAEKKFREWREEKKKKAEDENQKKTEEEERKAKEADEKKKKAEEAFKTWKENAEHRPVTAPYSYGYADGKLTGYYDKTSNPPPSYINPQPWVSPDVQKSPQHRNFHGKLRTK